MSGVVDLLVRLLGENDGAVRAVRQVGEEVDKTDRKVEESSGRLQKWGSLLSGAVAGIGSVVGGFQAADIFNNLTGMPGKINDALQRVSLPTSGGDLAKSILQAGALQANQAAGTPSGLLRQLGDYFTGKSGLNPIGGTLYDRQRQALDLFRDQVLQNPELASAALRSGGFGEQTPQFQQVFNQWANRATASQQFTKGVTAGNTINNTSNVNVNVTSGVGDPRQIGSDVQSTLDSYYRLNPHLQAPYPAVGYQGR